MKIENAGTGKFHTAKFHLVGMDLAGPANADDTAVVILHGPLEGRLQLVRAEQGMGDREIREALDLPGENWVVGLDAPLSYNPGGGDRSADAEMRRQVVKVGLRPGSIMAPTLTRMAYLTLRGMAVARLVLATHPGARIAEVHPGGALALGGAPVGDVRAMKTDEDARVRLMKWMAHQGIPVPEHSQLPVSDHMVCAFAAALAAWKWSRGESALRIPADPPFHPFDCAC